MVPLMEKGDPLIVDGKPAEFVEYTDDFDGTYIIYKRRGEAGEFWMTTQAFAIRASRVDKGGA